MKILIVEDDPDSRVMLQSVLESAQHQVLSATNGEQALLCARKELPDLIISDIMMPKMDGFELCYALKHDVKVQHIPIIFCTATYVDSADERLALQLGAERFMLKPIEPQELLECVDQWDPSLRRAEIQRTESQHLSLKHEDFLQQYQPRVTRKLDEKVRELELYKNIYQTSSDLFCILNPAGHVLQANNAFKTFFSSNDAGLHQLDLGKFLRNRDIQALLKQMHKREPFQSEVRIGTPAGTKAFLDISALPFLDENAQLSAIIVQARDITQRCKHTEELEMLRHLVDISNDAFFVIRGDNGRFEYVNGRACQRLGYTRSELISLNVVDIVLDFADMEDWHRHVELMHDNPAAVFESVHVRKDGTHLPVEVSVMHDQSEDRPALISAVARDISERRIAEEREKKLELKLNQSRTMEALGTLAGGIAHDFNNIIGSISGYTEMAQRSLGKPDKLNMCLAQVMNASQRARDLVGQILTFSRRGNRPLRTVYLKDIADEVIELLHPTAGDKIKIKTAIDSDCHAVMADPVQMHQVIMNLGTNALHAMEKQEHGTLRISLQNKSIDPSHAATDLTLSAGEYVELKVNDDGCGIDEDAKQRIFEPYFSTRKKQGGTGLGLAVVHSIIKDFNGSISLESYPEQGTTFTVLIPAADIEQINPISEDNSNKNRTGAEQVEDEIHPRHVLVVDPDDKAAALAKNILEPRGYKITSTGSSSKALEIFTRRKNQFDVVIADYALAEMNGIELAKELRAFHPDIPILLCRDYSSGVKQHDIREAGVQMVLNKPLQGYQLSLAVDSILNT